MPELPEVETIRLQLDSALKGLKITGIEVLKTKSFQGNPKEIIGQKVIKVFRRAKITFIELEGGNYLAIHLKLTGQLILRTKGEKPRTGKEKEGPYSIGNLPNKYTRVIISFDKSKLYFNDVRIFGWIRIIKNLNEAGEEKFGPEANNMKSFTLEYFQTILSKSGKPVKLIILDQEKLAGIGNIYANEALFLAGILPLRPGNSLSKEETVKLRDSIIAVLNEAIAHKGSSDKDEAYRQISGEKGTHQNYILVYGKKGQPCPKCKGIIKRIAIGGRGSFYCPGCQN